MRVGAPPVLLAPDATVVWERVMRAVSARGTRPEDPKVVGGALVLAFGLAMDARIAHKLTTAAPEERRELEALRRGQQRLARAGAWQAGLLERERIGTAVQDASGADAELAELVVVDKAALAAAVAATLAMVPDGVSPPEAT